MPPYLPLLVLSVLTHSPSAVPATPVGTLETVTACVAATRADVEDALGQSVQPGREQVARLESTCDYTGFGGQVSIAVHHSEGKLDVPAEIASLKAALPDATLREVPGIGTRAFYLDMAGIGTQLHIIRGDHDYLLVSVLGFGDPADVAPAAEFIARKALERL